MNASAAVRANLPVCVQWTMACWANVSNLRIADWAHDKIAVDWCGALRANAVVRQLVLTKGNVKILLLTVNEVAAWTQNNVSKQANNRNNRKQSILRLLRPRLKKLNASKFFRKSKSLSDKMNWLPR